MHIDHLVYGARNLERAADDIEAMLGERPTPGGQHVGLGTRNYLLALGGATYLEIIGPDLDQGDPISPRPFGLDDLADDRLVGWAVATTDIETALVGLLDESIDLGPARSMERIVPGGETLHWRLTAPRSGSIPFLIDWSGSTHPTETLTSQCRLHSLRVETPNAASVKPVIDAFGVEVDVRGGPEERLAATIDTPAGRVVLW